MLIHKNPPQPMSPAEAEALAQKCQAEDSEWTYRAVHDPLGTGNSFVEVQDEDGNILGRL